MRPDRDWRNVIPLHGPGSERRQADGTLPPDDLWNPARIVDEAPAPLRSLVLDLLGAMGVDQAAVEEIRRSLDLTDPSPGEPEQMGAAVSVLRAAVERAAVLGASPEITRIRHDCLDAACVAWADDTLERQATAQRRFLRDVSHDIRSPLNSILFLADALRSRHSGDLNSVQSRQVDVLFMASVTLVKLVNDLIDFSHLDSDADIQVASSPFSVESVVDDVQSLMGPLLAYHEVSFDVRRRETNPRKGDSQILNRVLLNLVSNAVQALGEGGKVRLEVWDGPTGTLEVSVTDNGAGADIDRIQAALRAALVGEALTVTEGWTHGLGLSISARLVAAAGGTLDAEAGETGGTRLLLSLPFGVL
ncbi:MAG: HAMP domain-containing histidine kinase [Gemmatimonadales bacterium]|nr:MAG: HAMP domain-containing histidine kinase [Gemmatimonadales bacterium]